MQLFGTIRSCSNNAFLPLPCLLQKGSKLFHSVKNTHQNSEKTNRDGVVQLYLLVIKIFEMRQKS